MPKSSSQDSIRIREVLLTRRKAIPVAAAVGSTVLMGTGSRVAGADKLGPRRPWYGFPDGFLWGAGTSGLQHEGSPLADGAAPSAMYEWAHAAIGTETEKPDWFSPPVDTFDVTADLYRRYRDDMKLMRELNLQVYNFEIYWPRILPGGTGPINQTGLDYYDRLVADFLANNLIPLCNLYVFDHPAALQQRGGWLNRDIPQWYAKYCEVIFDRLGDRVAYWTTICEIPIVHAFTNGSIGPAPDDESATLRAMHHLLLGQGLAVQALRASKAKGQIGNQHLLFPAKPASDREADITAARMVEAYSNLLLLDSQLKGTYPEDLAESMGAAWPTDAILDGDLGIISEPIDFIGIDYYGTQLVRQNDSKADHGSQVSMERVVDGEGFRDALIWLKERYGDRPVFILEIGEALDFEERGDEIDDTFRIEYLRDLLTGMHAAIESGVDVRSCFIWSFVDGWEFGWGLTRRYGLVHVDFEDQARTVKSSGRWYRDLIAANGFEYPGTTSRESETGDDSPSSVPA